MQEPNGDPHAFRPVPKTGVIYVTTEATKLGFSSSDPDWCNLGQGQPETGELPGAHSVGSNTTSCVEPTHSNPFNERRWLR